MLVTLGTSRVKPYLTFFYSKVLMRDIRVLGMLSITANANLYHLPFLSVGKCRETNARQLLTRKL